MAPINATYQDIEGSQSLLTLTLEERMLELEKNTIKKPSMLVKVLCALAVFATVGIAYTTGHSVGHGAVTNFAIDGSDDEPAYGRRAAAGHALPGELGKPSRTYQRTAQCDGTRPVCR